MYADKQLSEPIRSDDALVTIGDIAAGGQRLHTVHVPGLIQAEMSETTMLIFKMIGKLAGAAELPISDSET